MRVSFVYLAMSMVTMPLVSFAQPADADGYAIITSRDTILGKHSCYPTCAADADCPNPQRCVEVPDHGALCLAVRAGDPPPMDLSACEDDLGCQADQLCLRRRGPTKVNEFVAHKRARGFTVHLVDETQWGGGVGDAGADNIRAWLRANYVDLNLRYVLLIGDPRPTGDVPMRGSRPANNAYQDWAGNPVVLTDYYFADLDGNWDLDGDGALAEYSVNPNQIEEGSPASTHPDNLTDDMGPGGVNRESEVSVGRIPFYGDVDDLDHILQKTMDYENAPADSIGWRRSALLAAEGQHRAFFGELIRSEILLPNGLESYRVYDVEACWDEELNEDVDCRSPIDGVPEELTCNPTNVEAGINAFRPGFVSWLTHGSGRGAQAVMLQGNARSLPDDKPFFTFQASCYNGQPTTTDNLAYELLLNGAIGTIGAATISHGPGAPMPSLRNDAGNAGMAYNFADRLLAQGMSAGDALSDLRRTVGLSNRWWYWKNYLTFNLWGDPSIGIGSHAIDVEPVDGGVEEDLGVADAGMEDLGVEDLGPSVDAGDVEDSAVDAESSVVDMSATEDATVTDDPADASADSMDGGINAMPDASADENMPSESSSSGGCTVASETGSPLSFLTGLAILVFGLIRRTNRRF